jgi:hypothetical protein
MKLVLDHLLVFTAPFEFLAEVITSVVGKREVIDLLSYAADVVLH